MKIKILFMAILLTFAFCETVNEENNYHPNEDYSQKIEDFFTGFFNYFSLSKPNQIISCFSNGNTKLFFKSLWVTQKIISETNDRKTFWFDFDLYKWNLLEQELQGTLACITLTQDFTNLLDALDIKERNLKEFKTAIYLYYQAYYSKLLEDFNPVIGNLKDGNSKASGTAFATVINNLVNTVRKDGFDYLAYMAYSNGEAMAIEIESPGDSLKCFDQEAARMYMEFAYKNAKIVVDGKWEESALNTIKFWENEGEALMNKIPESVWNCWMQSKDAAALKAKLGVDVSDMAYIDLMLKYNNDRPFSYYAFMKGVKSAFDESNFMYAGMIDGHYIKSVSALNEKPS